MGVSSLLVHDKGSVDAIDRWWPGCGGDVSPSMDSVVRRRRSPPKVAARARRWRRHGDGRRDAASGLRLPAFLGGYEADKRLYADGTPKRGISGLPARADGATCAFSMCGPLWSSGARRRDAHRLPPAFPTPDEVSISSATLQLDQHAHAIPERLGDKRRLRRRLSRDAALQFGASGYLYKQVTDDRLNGQAVAGGTVARRLRSARSCAGPVRPLGCDFQVAGGGERSQPGGGKQVLPADCAAAVTLQREVRQGAALCPRAARPRREW